MKIGVVVVIYKSNPRDLSLIKVITQEICKNSNLELLVFENSANEKSKKIKRNKEGYYFYKETKNLGTAGAYSFAIDFFMNLKCKYIILLDQDSIIDCKYFNQINELLSFKNISVAIPKVISNRKQVSPSCFNFLWGPSSRKPIFKITSFKTAISSGSIHSMDLISSFKPFPKELWLDYFDHWLFLKYSNSNVKIDLIDFEISHDLSIQNLSSISSFRLKNIYSSEKYFFFNHLGRLSLFTYYLKITLRLVKILITTPSQFPRCFKFLFL